jgi:hypothetical protein
MTSSQDHDIDHVARELMIITPFAVKLGQTHLPTEFRIRFTVLLNYRSNA